MDVANLKAAIFANLNGLDGQLAQFQVKANPTLKKSECWQKFGHVHTLNGDLVTVQGTSFVACYVCHTVYTFKSKNGTSTIMGHKCPHEKEAATHEDADKKEARRKAKNPDLDALKREITKALIEDDVMKGYTLLSNPAATKSDCWKRFGHVYHHGTLLEAFDSGFVACYGCKVVYQYKVRNGTSTMTTHTCTVSKDEIEHEARKGIKRATSSVLSLQDAKPIKKPRDDVSDLPPKKALEVLKQTIAASLLNDREQSPFELRPNANESKAECWQRFGFVYRNQTLLVEQGTHFVACYDCKAVYQFKSKNGTSSLLSHTCPMRKANDKMKHTLVTELAQLCFVDVLPPSLLDGAGFRSLWRTLMEMSKSPNTHSLDKWVPETNGVVQALQTQYLAIRMALNHRIAPLIAEHLHVGVSYSPFTAMSTKMVSISVHFIDTEYVLHDRVIDVIAVTDALLAHVHQSLADMGVVNVTLVHDIDQPEWMALYPHQLVYASTPLQAAFTAVLACGTDDLNGDEVSGDASRRAVHSVLRVAARMVQGGGPSNVDAWTISSDMTWQSLLQSLQYIHSQWMTRQQLWVEFAPSDTMPQDVHLHVVEALLNFAALFVSAAQALEKPNGPTLHAVCYWRHALIQHCRAISEDDILTQLKAVASTQVQQWPLTTTHVMAALVDPGQRKRLSKFGLTNEAIVRAKNQLCALLHEMMPHVKLSPRKQPRDAILSMYGGDSDEEDLSTEKPLDVQSEMTRYFDNAIVDEPTGDVNLLTWWKWQSKRFPLLSRAVRSILCLPATSRLDKQIMTHRSMLSPKHAKEILFLHSNRDLRSPTVPSPPDPFVL